MDLDYERVSALLNIVDKCAGHSGKLGSISNVALGELMQLNNAIKAQAAAKPQVEETLDEDDDNEGKPAKSTGRRV